MSYRAKNRQWMRITIKAPMSQFYNRPFLNLLEHLRYSGAGEYRFEKNGEEVDIQNADSVVIELLKPEHMRGLWSEMLAARVASFGDKAEPFTRRA